MEEERGRRSRSGTAAAVAGAARYICQPCKKEFLNEINFQKHLGSLSCRASAPRYKCPRCRGKFRSGYTLKRHLENFHPRENEDLCFCCGICSECFQTAEETERHREERHRRHHDFQLQQSAHKRACQLLRAFFPGNIRTMEEALVYAYPRMNSLLESVSTVSPYYRVSFTAQVEMVRLGERGQEVQLESFPFRSYAMKVVRGEREEDVRSELRRICGDIDNAVESFLYMGSGWAVKKVLFLDAEVTQCKPLSGAGGCGLHEAKWKRGRGIDPGMSKSEEEEEGEKDCFYRAIAAHFAGENASRAEEDAFLQSRVTRLPFPPPVRVKDIGEFETLNAELDLAINVVYQDDSAVLLPLRASKNLRAKNVIVLLLFHTSNGEQQRTDGAGHYSLVRNPSLLFAKRRGDGGEEKGVKGTYQRFICYNCFQTQYRKSTHEAHVAFCHQNGSQRIKMPEEGDVLSFETSSSTKAKQFLSAFTLYYDFESLQIPPDKACSCPDRVLENTRAEKEEDEWWAKLPEEDRRSWACDQIMVEGELNELWGSKVLDALERGKRPRRLSPLEPPKKKRRRVCSHKTKIIAEQPPFAYSLLLVDRDGNIKREKTYIGTDAAYNFILTVLNLADEFLPQLTPGVPMEAMTVRERAMAMETDICYLCEEEMEAANKVLDHDHLNGEFLGVAHSACNLARREQCVMTAFAHNFSG